MMQHSFRRTGMWCFGVSAAVLLLIFSLQERLSADHASWVSQAMERVRQGDHEGALTAFQQAAWERPQDPAIHYNMGVLTESLGRLGESVEHYTAYLRWAPDASDREAVKRKIFQLCGHLGAQAYQDRRYLLALDWYEKAKRLYPYAKAVHYNMSRVYEARGEWLRAAESLKEFASLCSPSERGPVNGWIVDLLRKEAEARFGGGDYEGALASFREAARWDKQDGRLLLHQAICEERLGRFEAAKNHYLAYLQFDPTTRDRGAILERVVRLHVLLAQAAIDQRHLERAQDILDKGLEIDPGNPDLHYLSAKTYLGQGKPAQAVAYLERTLQRVSKEEDRRPYLEELVRLCTSEADEAYRRRQYGHALGFLKKALYWDPDNPAVAYNLARVYERERDWEQAILAYRRFLFLNPDAAERNEVRAKLAYHYSFLGTERFARQEYPQAQEAFEQALLIRPEDPALLYNLAMVLLKRGRSTEALHFLQRYLNYESDPREIERVRQQVGLLVRGTEEKGRQRAGKLASAGLEALDRSGKGPEDLALADREKAYLLLQAGQWKEALSLYQACLRVSPGLRKEEAFQKEVASVYREISRAALLAGNTAEAMDALDRARNWAPSEAFPYLWQGNLHEHQGNADEALRIYQEALRNVKGAEGREAIRNRIAAILTQRLQAALRRQDLSLALKTMKTLEPYLGESQARDVHYQKARIEGALGRRDEALIDYGLHLFGASHILEDPRIREEVLTLLRHEPGLVSSIDDPSEAYRRAREAARRGDHSEALFCFVLAGTDERSPPELDAEILRSLDALGMHGEALALLSRRSQGPRPFQLSRTQTDHLIQRSQKVLWEDYRTGQYEKGLERIRGLQAQLPESDARLVLFQGVFEEMAGSYQDALYRYERVLGSAAMLPEERASPVRERLCALLIRKALAEYEEGNYEACLESLRRAERLVPGRPDVAFDLGCVYLRLNNPNAALQAFSRYLDLVQEESPRKELTGSALLLLERQMARSPLVRYEGQDIAVDLIFQRSVSLGRLISGQGRDDGDGGRGDLLDRLVLAPYLEMPLGEEGLPGPRPFAVD